MPYTKKQTEHLAKIREMLKVYSKTEGYSEAAKSHLDAYKKLKSRLKVVKNEEDCIKIMNSLIELVGSAHKDCNTEFSNVVGGKGLAKFVERTVVDTGKSLLGTLNFLFPKQIPVSTIGDTIKSLEQIRDCIVEKKERTDRLVMAIHKGQMTDGERKELEKPLSEQSMEAESQNFRDVFTKRALEKFDKTIQEFKEMGNKDLIENFPCTAAYIRILSGIGGVSKYEFGERIIPGGFIGKLFNILTIICMKRIDQASEGR